MVITPVAWSVRPTTIEEINNNRPYVTSSMVEAIVTCPRWGIIHAVQRRRFVSGYRQMALEAGSLVHEIFAAFNLLHLAKEQGMYAHAQYHGEQLFSEARYNAINFAEAHRRYDIRPIKAYEYLVYNVVGSSEYYDDPNDKNRTVANIEHVGLRLAEHYLSELARFNIHVEDETDPMKSIGIEKSLDVVFNIMLSNDEVFSFRFIGLADVLYTNNVTKLVKLGEFKTTSSMNEGWEASFRTRHQLTAYMAALHAYFDHVSLDTILTGSTIPVRKTTTPVMTLLFDREEQNFLDFFNTVRHAWGIIQEYKNEDVIFAPMFTHSCNRYFRPCSLIDFCTAAHEDQVVMLEQMAFDANLSPSEAKALLRRE